MVNQGVVQIVEILQPALAGMTQPFLCRGEDNLLYFVKGAHTGRKWQIHEWLGSSLALEFGLPAAKCAIVEINEELISLVPHDWKKIGAGFAFGSVVVPRVMDINVGLLSKIPADVQRDVLVFDYWIRNADRSLSALGGNPNLLWNPEASEIVVFDHNMAFDEDFNKDDFFSTHIFRDQQVSVFSDWIFKDQYQARLSACLDKLESIWDQMPDSWHCIDHGVAVDLDLGRVYQMLAICKDETLWNTK